MGSTLGDSEMKNLSDEHRTPSERVEDLPRILDALRQAVREALLRHKQAGNPIAVWREGRVVWIPPEEIPAD
jgi:hypothetical protein